MSELSSVEFYPGKHSRLREKKIFCDACLPRGASKRELEARFDLCQTALSNLDEIYESFLKSIIEPLEQFIATSIRDAYSGLTFNGVDNKTFMPFLYCQLDEDICIAVSFFVNLENYLSNYCSTVIRLNSVVHTQAADVFEEIAKHLVTYLSDDAVDPTTTLSVVLDIVLKKIQAGRRMKPVVIILEQSYRFDGEFLNDILKSCYAIFRKINILIICFNVHGISYFSDLLNPSVIEKLNIVQYSAVVSASALDSFMLSLFSSEKMVFFLKADAVKLLTRHVLSMDSSATNLVRTYRFCMLEHFRTQRCSTFCAPSAEFENTVLHLKEADLASLVADLKLSNFLPSKRSKSETALRSAIVGAGREFFNYRIAFCDALRCLHCLSACVPGHPFATTERQLLVMAQDEDFVHSNRWKQFFDWLPNVDRDVLQSTVDKCKETILNKNGCERLKSLLDVLNNLENCWLEEEKQKKSRKGATSTTSERSQTVVQNSLLSSQQLRKKLLHNYIETSTSSCSRMNKWSQELSEQFADLLRHVSSLLFYQIAYGNSVEAIHTSIIPSASKSIQESVLNLKDTDAATILRVLLDHQAENLSVKDWFSECRSQSTKSRSSKNIQARLSSFYRMLANLEYVGFIEPFTRRGEILMKEFIPNFADQQVRATLKKLVFFSLSIIVLPLGSMFFSKRFIFENLFGFDSSKSTTFSAILAIFIVHSPFFPSKFGGKPSWLSLANIPTAEKLLCSGCSQPMVFLLQLYAPDSRIEHAFHRSLFVFICRQVGCWNGGCTTGETIKVFRSQLCRENPFYKNYPLQAYSDEGDQAVQSVRRALKSCVVCGLGGDKVCGQCRTVCYCSKEHQKFHWSTVHKQQCGGEVEQQRMQDLENDTVALLFPELELVIERETYREKDKVKERPLKERMDEYRDLCSRNGYVQNLETENEIDQYLQSDSDLIKEPDKQFKRFTSRIQQNPKQARIMLSIQRSIQIDVVRYERNGEPLWAGKDVPVEIPKCQLCGAERNFEFQIMPYLLSLMDVDSVEAGGIDWATVCVYTCSASCDLAGRDYEQEYVWKQMYNE
ncbi:Programmed cell death protein 2 [Trichinella pseudospiralis]|uniref:Programmed cell death protein 2 n=1 Tax=Trichinella pseudospiralis TaxID=6337 RepID=A0A0V1FCC4_TRIPS|nr:Programmed cell death protein 2 [Trichinella pseudospiralis]